MMEIRLGEFQFELSAIASIGKFDVAEVKKFGVIVCRPPPTVYVSGVAGCAPPQSVDEIALGLQRHMEIWEHFFFEIMVNTQKGRGRSLSDHFADTVVGAVFVWTRTRAQGDRRSTMLWG